MNTNNTLPYAVALFAILAPFARAGNALAAPQLTEQEVAIWMKVQNALHPDDPQLKMSELKFSTQHGATYVEPHSFTAKQLNSYEPQSPPPEIGFQGKAQWPLGLFKLRESWGDVLALEDPTVKDAAGNKSYEDLKGAKFSWERDFKNSSDTWIAQAALVLPLVWINAVPANESGIYSFGLTPSATINRLHNEADDTAEVDKLTFRAGGFVAWNTGFSRGLDTILVRAAFAYQTDTGFVSSIPAGEFEIEPRFWLSRGVGIGYRQILWEKKNSEPTKPDENTILAYQARLRVRGEYGQFHKVAETQPPQPALDEDFFHLGFKAGVEFDPFFFRKLTASLDYSYLPTLSGPHANDSLFQAELAIELWKLDSGAKGGLSVKYVRGGLGFDQQQVDTLFVGLSALY